MPYGHDGVAHTQIHAVNTQKKRESSRENLLQACVASGGYQRQPIVDLSVLRTATCSMRVSRIWQGVYEMLGRNHFAVVCRGRGSRKTGGKYVHTADTNDTSGLFIGTVFVGGVDRNEWHTMLKGNEQ